MVAAGNDDAFWEIALHASASSGNIIALMAWKLYFPLVSPCLARKLILYR